MKPNNKTKLAALIALAILATSSMAALPSATAAPTTFTVNVTTDESDANAGDGTCETPNTGECTLRAAIEEANANVGADTIEFNIPGSGVHLIQPASELPDITEALTIDGYANNPGATPNTAVSPAPINSVINIEVDNSTGLYIDGLTITTDDVTIRGLAIDGFINGIWIDGSLGSVENVSIKGNYLGTDATGESLNVITELNGIRMADCSNITIGGTDPSDRNILVGSNSGVELLCSDVSIFGNYIGVKRDGVNSIVGETQPNGGVGVVQPLNQSGPPYTNLAIGGPATGQGNLIAGVPGTQIVLAGIGNVVQGNIIGGDYNGVENANVDSGSGISLYGGGSNMLIGGTGAGEGNIIVGTKGAAIANFGVEIPLFSVSLVGQNNAFLGNRIFDVGVLDYYDFGDSNIGIDLLNSAYDGAPSGPPESFFDTGPNATNIGNNTNRANNYLRSPVLNSAVQDGNQLSIDFDLDVIGSDSNQYRVEFFANETSTVFGTGPGENYLGSTTVDTGNTTIDLTLGSSADITNSALSATVTPLNSTGPDGFGGTSEFAQNIEIGSVTDFDADGIADEIEDAGPNSGDGNDDGLLDSEQSTVSTFLSANSGYYTTFVTEGCFSNGFVESIASDIFGTDTGFEYPFGMTDFTLNCSKGDTVEVNKYIFTPETNVTDFSIRKFDPVSDSFISISEIPNSDPMIESATIGGEHAIHLTYSLTDGAVGDDDLTENGIIVDPVGLAEVFTSSSPSVENPDENTTTATGTLANTGIANVTMVVGFAIIAIAFGVFLILLKRDRTKVNK
jgi:CSLREA domain-containing protein